jgi:hypothetical protein
LWGHLYAFRVGLIHEKNRICPEFGHTKKNWGGTKSGVLSGEGQTALVEREQNGVRFYAKLESLNPSGSFKDRNSAIVTSFLNARELRLWWKTPLEMPAHRWHSTLLVSV